MPHTIPVFHTGPAYFCSLKIAHIVARKLLSSLNATQPDLATELLELDIDPRRYCPLLKFAFLSWNHVTDVTCNETNEISIDLCNIKLFHAIHDSAT